MKEIMVSLVGLVDTSSHLCYNSYIISCFTELFGNYTKYYEWQGIEFMITTHKNCKTEVVSGSGPHFASLRCVDHNKWITWLSQERAKELDPNFVPGIRNNFEELFNV